MVFVGARSEPHRRTALARPEAALLGAARFAAPATVPPSVVLSITALSVAAFGLCGVMGPFWSLPTAFLRGRAAAGARRVTAGRTEPRWRA